jgi:hypothetical protein
MFFKPSLCERAFCVFTAIKPSPLGEGVTAVKAVTDEV